MSVFIITDLDKAMDTLNTLNKFNQQILQQLSNSDQVLKSAQNQVDYYKKIEENRSKLNNSNMHANITTEDVVKNFFNNLETISKQKNCNRNKMLKTVSKILFNTLEFDGELRCKMIAQSQQYTIVRIFIHLKISLNYWINIVVNFL